MSESSEARRPSSTWWRVASGPVLFLLVELFFRPELALAPELLAEHPQASPLLVQHAMAATCWIAAWWFTEALPIPVTSLLPLVLFPLLGLGSVGEVSREYGHELMFLFVGGVLIAVAMERTGLHERVAIRIIRLFGRGPAGLVLGFMVATAVVSMWISNTATTVMLLPVALAVLSKVECGEPKTDSCFPVALLLGIAFAANIGGLGTPIGSPPNLIFQSVYKAKTGVEVGFGQWMAYGVPLIVVLLPLTWWFLTRELRRTAPRVDFELARFGKLAADQRWVLVVFLSAATLWLTRGNFGDLQGWGSRLAEHGILVKDSTVAIVAATVLFIAPGKEGRPILDWSASTQLPWGILFLLGAGFAISSAFDSSGLTVWVGLQMESFGHLEWSPALLFLGLLAVIVATSILVTEFASNTASANILLPIVFGVCAALGTDRFPPQLLMVACALACTTGFAVPAGTPPNALVFSTGRVSIGRFVRRGLVVDLFSLILITAFLGALHLLA